ncbi:MAG: hypothetical protein O2843_03685 [Chloroflexi bacterium]|nr:hypothetical protein [Chloroflexota bacterium]
MLRRIPYRRGATFKTQQARVDVASRPEVTVKGKAHHFELHMSKPDETIPFYKDLLGYFEWKVLSEWPGGLGIGEPVVPAHA